VSVGEKKRGASRREVLASREKARMHRLDGRPSDWSAVNQKSWSASGSVLEER
jgi:hypothetical protein